MTPETIPHPRIVQKIHFKAVEACWTWTGGDSGNGYGKVRFQGKMHMAHRLIYTLLIGEIPEGMVLDHLCRNRRCVNPHHLEPVTVKENTHRGEAKLFGQPTVKQEKMASELYDEVSAKLQAKATIIEKIGCAFAFYVAAAIVEGVESGQLSLTR